MRKGDPELERQWRARLQEMASLGLGVTEYSRRSGIRPKTIYYWRKRVARLDAGESGPRQQLQQQSAAFVKVVGVKPPAGERDGLEVTVGRRYSVRIIGAVEPATFDAVLDVLEARP